MKAKINIRFPDGSIKTINKTIRDREWEIKELCDEEK